MAAAAQKEAEKREAEALVSAEVVVSGNGAAAVLTDAEKLGLNDVLAPAKPSGPDVSVSKDVQDLVG